MKRKINPLHLFSRLHILKMLAVLAALANPLISRAHEVRPAYLEITENNKHQITAIWKQPAAGEMALRIIPHISSGFLDKAPTSIFVDPGYFIKRWENIDARSVKLDGQEITIEGLEHTITDVLVNITLADGSTFRKILRPDQTSFTISKQVKQAVPVFDYIRLGVEHILEGFDHLLFVLGLLLLVKKRRLLIKTITAFTIAHSITLTCATMGWINLQPAVVEAVIALSIVFVAVELVRSYQGREGITTHYPWLVAFSFGLLHGFGFAGALYDIGLPPNDIPLALLLFNVGVELGQLLFVLSALSLIWVARKAIARLPVWTKFIPPYAIGSIAAFWLIERLITVIH